MSCAYSRSEWSLLISKKNEQIVNAYHLQNGKSAIGRLAVCKRNIRDDIEIVHQSVVGRIAHIIQLYDKQIWWPLRYIVLRNLVFRMKFKKKKLKNMQITNGNNKRFTAFIVLQNLNKRKTKKKCFLFVHLKKRRKRELRLFGCDINARNNEFECYDANGSN